MTRPQIGILSAVILIGAAGVLLSFGGDRDKHAIRDKLNALVELVEKDGAVSKFEALGRARKFKAIFDSGAFIEYLPSKSLSIRSDAMQSGFLRAWTQIDSASIRISQHEVDIDSDRAKAVSTFYAECRIAMDGSSPMSDTVFYRAYWVKADGEWLIEGIVAENTR